MQDDSGAPLPYATPLRRMLDKAKLKTSDILVEQIKQLINNTNNTKI
jgi:hypothetical protein